MARNGWGPDAARVWLRDAARSSRQTVVKVARELLASLTRQRLSRVLTEAEPGVKGSRIAAVDGGEPRGGAGGGQMPAWAALSVTAGAAYALRRGADRLMR